MFRIIQLISLVLVFASVHAAAEERTWTSANGTFTVKAELIRLDGQTAYLRRSDNGKEIAVKLSQLSASDRRFAREQAKKTPSNSQQAAAAKEQDKAELAPEPSLLDGAPILSSFLTVYPDRIKPGDHAEEVGKLLELIKLRAYPETLIDLADADERKGLAVQEDEMLFPAAQAKKLIELFVPQQEAQVYLDRRANEFQRIRAFQQIVERYNGKFLEAAPKPPFEAVFLEATPLGSYDRGETRFPLHKVNGNGIRPAKLGNIQLHYADDYPMPDSLPMSAKDAESLLNRLSSRNVILAAKVRFTDIWPDETQRYQSHASVELVGLSVYPFKSLSDRIHRYEIEQPKPNVAENIPVDVGSSEDDVALNKKMAALAAKYRLPSSKGLPVFPFKGVRVNSPQHKAIQNFLELVALGIDPDQIDQLAPQLIADHFPRNISSRYVAANQFRQPSWKGADEFEQREARKEFFEKHGEQLRQMAVKPPLRFLVVTKIGFTSYDFQRKGVALDGGGGLLRSVGGYFPSVLPPVRWQRFWQVEPDVVRKLENLRGRRFGYLLRAVDFHEPPLRSPHDRELIPPLIGRIESAELYADANLTQRVTDWELEQFPRSALEARIDQQVVASSDPPPLEELSIAGLVAKEPSITLAEGAWKDIWTEVQRRDEAIYSAASTAINLEGSAHATIASLNAENDTGYRRRGDAEEQRKRAEEDLKLAVKTLERLMRPDKRPFFPPNAPPLARDASLTGEQRELVRGWLQHRVESSGNRFTILAQIAEDPQTKKPIIRIPACYTAIDDHLKQRGYRAEQLLRLQPIEINPAYHPIRNVRFFEDRHFQQRLLRVDNNLQTTPILALPGSANALLDLIPEKLLAETLEDDKGSYQRALRIEVEIGKLEFLDISQGRGTDQLVLQAIPERIELLHKDKVLLAKKVDSKSLFQQTRVVEDTKKQEPPTGKEPAGEQGPEPGPLAQDGTPLRFSPIQIPFLVAKHHPEFFKKHTKQFMLARWGHELSLRNLPSRQQKQINAVPDYFFPASRSLPQGVDLEDLKSKFATWVLEQSETVPDQFTMQFNQVAFNYPYLKDIQAPALIQQAISGGPLHSAVRTAGFDYKSAQMATQFRRNTGGSIEKWTEALKIAPRDVYLTDQSYIIPDADGNRRSQTSGSFRTGGFGGGSGRGGGVSGIPVVSSSEPIYPLLRVDKEMWLPKDAALSSARVQPVLQTEFLVSGVEILGQPPAHPWVDARNRYHTGSARDLQVNDAGQYAVVEVSLKDAELVDAATGDSLIPLVLKDYRTVGQEAAKSEVGSEVNSTRDDGPSQGSARRDEPSQIDSHNSKRNSATTGPQVALESGPRSESRTKAAGLPKRDTLGTETARASREEPLGGKAESAELHREPGESRDSDSGGNSTLSFVLIGCGLVTMVLVAGGIVVALRLKHGRAADESANSQMTPRE